MEKEKKRQENFNIQLAGMAQSRQVSDKMQAGKDSFRAQNIHASHEGVLCQDLQGILLLILLGVASAFWIGGRFIRKLFIQTLKAFQ